MQCYRTNKTHLLEDEIDCIYGVFINFQCFTWQQHNRFFKPLFPDTQAVNSLSKRIVTFGRHSFRLFPGVFP